MESPRIFLVILIGFLSVGTVVKRKDGIEMTRTDPVAYAEKQKEEREGKKGPPAPSLKIYPKEKFLVEGPVEKGKEEVEEPPQPEEESLDWDTWFEEEEEPESESEEDFKDKGLADDTSDILAPHSLT